MTSLISNWTNFLQCFGMKQGIIICETKDEAYKYFNQTIMDGIDNGIYAIVINRHGIVETKNT